MSFYEHVIRPIAFRFDAERMHNASLHLMRGVGGAAPLRALVRRCHRVANPRLSSEVGGIRFENPVGLAAGYDKSGTAVRGLAALGFGFLEIGSISADASTGNPKPRLFRLPESEAIVVHYGLPNDGAEAVARRLAKMQLPVPLGINLVNTNRRRPESEEAILQDFDRSVGLLKSHADYLALNLSCPNTDMGPTFFGERGHVARLLNVLNGHDLRVPLFLKVSPLGGVEAIELLLEAVAPFDFVTGFIFNTPGGKPAELGLTPEQERRMPGAVTGRVHQRLANQAIQEMYRRMDRHRYRIIGVGGVFSGEDAYRKIRLGASLVQLLTSLVYRGPGVVRTINRSLAGLLERDGFDHVSEAVGVDVDPSTSTVPQRSSLV